VSRISFFACHCHTKSYHQSETGAIFPNCLRQPIPCSSRIRGPAIVSSTHLLHYDPETRFATRLLHRCFASPGCQTHRLELLRQFRREFASHPILACTITKKAPSMCRIGLILKAGDEIRTHDVQLGKLNTPHSETAFSSDKGGFSSIGDCEVTPEVTSDLEKTKVSAATPPDNLAPAPVSPNGTALPMACPENPEMDVLVDLLATLSHQERVEIISELSKEQRFTIARMITRRIF